MRTLHKLTHTILTLAALVVMSAFALAADPGTPYDATWLPSDQMAGNVLVYNIYTSSLANPTAENTRISITNADDQNGVSVHFFFIDGSNCSVADSFVCLTPNQTMTFFAADADPGVTGYIIAVATNANGVPRPAFGLEGGARLIGDEQVRFANGLSANLGAEALWGVLAAVNPNGDLAAELGLFLPRVLAISNQPSLADGYDIRLIVNRISGDMRVAADSIGSIFGLTFDELENPYSWTSSAGCQLNRSLNNTTFPRTTPRINSIIPAGSVGWTKFWSTSGDRGILGAVLFGSTSPSNFTGGRNLHKLTFAGPQTLIVPVFPSNCGF